MEVTGLDDTIWPEAFARMEQFTKDVKLQPEDTDMEYSPVIDMFSEGKVAMIRAGGSNTVWFNRDGTNAMMLPYFGQNGEQWLLTYPMFQVAVSSAVEQDAQKQDAVIRVLEAMFSEEGQKQAAVNKAVLTYNKDVDIQISDVFSPVS